MVWLCMNKTGCIVYKTETNDTPVHNETVQNFLDWYDVMWFHAILAHITEHSNMYIVIQLTK